MRSALLLAVLGFSIPLCATENNQRIRVLLHDHGRTTSVDGHSLELSNLIRTCEQALTSAPSGNMAQLLVFRNTIKEIRKQGVSWELVYPKVRQFDQKSGGGGGGNIEASRLLLELHGPHADGMQGGRALVFYGANGDYSSGPYASNPGYEQKIRDLLRKLGQDF